MKTLLKIVGFILLNFLRFLFHKNSEQKSPLKKIKFNGSKTFLNYNNDFKTVFGFWNNESKTVFGFRKKNKR